MKRGQHQQQRQIQRQTQRQAQAKVAENAVRQAIDAEYEYAERGSREDAFPPDEAWLAERDDGWSWEERPARSYDREWSTPLATLGSLPRRLSPPILFRIDRDLEVHGKIPPPSPEGADSAPLPIGPLRTAIAEAIALHIREQAVAPLERTGDWANIPLLGGDPAVGPGLPKEVLDEKLKKWNQESEHLVRLVARLRGGRVARDVAHRIWSTPYFLDFAIRLPNGDVIAPKALLKLARDGKRATRAGALRQLADAPDRVAGEEWSASDWRGFRQSQSNSRNRKG